MGIDYEAEYNNRARVPAYPEIFARWHREAQAYRERSSDARLGLRYGGGARQTIDLFPGRDAEMASPALMFIHGGWWRSLHPDDFSHLAAGPNARGVTVAVVGYDLCPTVTITDIVGQMRAAALFLWGEWRRPFAVAGHSAGGHLSACLLATEWRSLDPQAPENLVPAAYAISGVFDLAPLTETSINADLRLDERSARELSPIHWPVPSGRILDAVVGGEESSEFLRQSQAIASAWRPHAETRYEAIAGRNHFDVIDALADPDSPMTTRVVELARGASTVRL